MDYILLDPHALYISSHEVTLIIQYTAGELFQLRPHFTMPPMALHPDVTFQPRRKYIHHGSRRNFRVDNSKPIRSLWSSTRHPSRKPWRTVDHSVLTYPTRSASFNPSTNSSHTFRLFDTCSLTNKGPLLYDLLTGCKFDFFCLTETWQQPNDFSQIDHSWSACAMSCWEPL